MTTNGPRCSFCGKNQSDVRSLVAGAVAFICDECVRVAVEVIGGEHSQGLDELREAIDRGDATISRLC
jgi:ATP-dependent protease Clp ATPase subunit